MDNDLVTLDYRIRNPFWLITHASNRVHAINIVIKLLRMVTLTFIFSKAFTFL